MSKLFTKEVVDAMTELARAVARQELNKNGVMSTYPEKHTKEVKDAKNILLNLE